MLRRVLAPLHPDGFKFVLAAALATVLLFLLWTPAGWAAAVVTLWMVYFFRDPWRVTPTREGLLVSPADGIVTSVTPARPPPELEMGDTEVARIGIFLNIFDVHVTRAPVGGRVVALRYTKGRFVNASHEEASLNNETDGDSRRSARGSRDRLMCRSPVSSPAASSATCARASVSRRASGWASSALAHGSMFIVHHLM